MPTLPEKLRYTEAQPGVWYRWPCPNGSDGRGHAGKRDGSKWILRCWPKVHNYADLLAEIGLQPRAASWEPGPYDQQYLIATYASPRGSTSRFRRDYPAQYPNGPCLYPHCTNTAPHKHYYQRKGDPTEGCALLPWGVVKPDSILVVCEGEKAAGALDVPGYVAVSYPGGSGMAGKADYSICEGRKVVVWPDDDEAGAQAANISAAQARFAGATEVLMVWLEEPEGDGSDAYDFDPATQAELLANATPIAMQEAKRRPDVPEGYRPPLLRFQAPAYDAMRFLSFSASRIVLVRYTQDTSTRLEPYVRLQSGLLDNGAALQQELMAMTSYTVDRAWELMSDKEAKVAVRYANHAISSAGIAGLKYFLPGAAAEIGWEKLQEAGLDVVDAADIGNNMRYAAFSNGIVDKRMGKLLTSVDRGVYIIGNCRWPYEPEATHPDVDTLMPPIGELTDEQMKWWRWARGVMSHRPPMRELITQISEPNAGKSTWRNWDLASLHPYVTTMRAEGLQRGGKLQSGTASHNGDVAALASPSWWCYVPEIAKADPELLNQASGGEGLMPIRRVGEKQELIFVTGHIVVQGNLHADGVKMLGLGGGDESDALAQRISPMSMKAIANPEQRLLASVHGSRERCIAWIARTIQDAVLAWQKFGDEETGHIRWPPQPDSMRSELDRMRLREASDWERDFLLTHYEKGTNGALDEVKMTEVMREYHEWHQREYGSGTKPVSRKMVTSRLKKHLVAQSKGTGHETYVWPVRRKSVKAEPAAAEPDDTPQEEAISEDWMT